MATSRLPSQFFVVCFGGSAGALHAYLEIIRSVGAKTGMAFVVISHRGTSNPHLLSQVLSSATTMAVIDVEDGTPIVPDCVFVAPGGAVTTFDGERLHLGPAQLSRGWPTTISEFLFSMAHSAGPRSIAVILSGKDHDGSSALRSVRAAGGTSIAQANAATPEMPAAALATGCVDFFLPSSEIADQLLKIAGRGC